MGFRAQCGDWSKVKMRRTYVSGPANVKILSDSVSLNITIKPAKVKRVLNIQYFQTFIVRNMVHLK